MKTAVRLLTICAVGLSAQGGYAQWTTLTMNEPNMTSMQVFASTMNDPEESDEWALWLLTGAVVLSALSNTVAPVAPAVPIIPLCCP